MMNSLYQLANDTGKNVTMEFFPNGHHMDLPTYSSYFERLNAFLEKL